MVDDEFRARLIALDAHAGQEDADGQPHLDHVILVAQAVEGGEQRVVALLHDVFEDSRRRAGRAWTPKMLRTAGFSPTVVAAVEILTRGEDEPYMDYIERVVASAGTAAGELALPVKRADLRVNLARCRPGHSLRRRYERALARLEEVTHAATH